MAVKEELGAKPPTEEIPQGTPTNGAEKEEKEELQAEEPELEKDSDAEEGDETTHASPEEPSEEIANLTRLEDGTYRYIVDPDDPRSTVYVGKTERELWENVTKGFKAKDSFIQQMKAERAIPKPSAKEDEEPELPEESDILARQAKKSGIDPAMLSWSDDEWKNYELENGAYATMRKAQMVDQVRSQATQEYNRRTAQALNHQVLTSEMKNVTELCEAYHVDIDSIDWDALLEKLHADPKRNYMQSGLLAPGAFTREAILEIRRVSDHRSKDDLKQKVAKEIADKRTQQKQAATTSGKGTGVVKKVTEKSFATLDELTAHLKEQARKGII